MAFPRVLGGYVHTIVSWRVRECSRLEEGREILSSLGTVRTVQFTVPCVMSGKHKSLQLILIPHLSL